MPLDSTGFDFSAVPPREDGALRTIVLYNPFNPADRQIMDIAWEKERTVADYIGALDGNWLVVLNGREIKPEEWATTTALAEDTMVVAQVPQKGAGGILKMVLMIALVVVAAYAAGPLGAALAKATGIGLTAATTIASASIMIAGSFLINALLPDPQKPQQEASNSSPSYGIDGAKATSREDVPVPVVYGEFRVAGNRVNVHVENSSDGLAQTFYAQYAVSEGPIEAISDIEINSQPLSAYQSVETATQLGTLDQEPLNWFDQIITPNFDGRTITQTPITYDTITAVDKLRLDLAFPQGLAETDSKNGARRSRSVSFVATATNLATNTVYPIRSEQWNQVTLNASNQTSVSGNRMRVTVRARYKARMVATGELDAFGQPVTAPAADSGDFNFTTTLRQANGTVLLEKTETGKAPASDFANTDPATDDQGGFWGATLTVGNKDFVYEVSGDGQPHFEVLLNSASPDTADVSIVSVELLGLSNNLTITRAERSAVRFSLVSEPLPRGLYRVSLHRTTDPSTSDYVSDDVVLTDVNEIITDKVAYIRTASYAIKVKLTDQLSSEPSVTAKVRGRKVKIYDANGGHTGPTWSNNPADVVLDILLSDSWERKFSHSRIDFPAFVRWRAACVAQGLAFNGTFDSSTNVWDALMVVCRVGRANLVVVGTKWSVVLEAVSEPVMIFGDHNIIAGSFRNEWFGRESRANRVEAQYYDKTDRNKRKSVFATDEEALSRGQPIRDATINLIGVDDALQAQKEADLQLRINQAIVQGCKFSTYLDAIGCLPGDVVLVQHTMPAWGWATRVKSVSGSVITLESPLAPATGGFEEPPPPYDPLPAGDWRVMVARPAVQRAIATVQGASGSLLTVSGVHTPAADPNLPHVRRVVVNSADFRVIDQTFLASQTVYILDRPTGATVGMQAGLWATEVLQQGTIGQPNEWDRTVTLSGWEHGPVQPGDHILIGRTTSLGKQFRVKRLTYTNEQERELELIEYDPWVYEPTGTVPVGNSSELQVSPLHVVGLAADTFPRPNASGVNLHYARVTWVSPLNDQWGHAGAKVYVSRDFADFFLYETVPVGRTDSVFEANVGETIRFKVVAYAESGTTAPYTSAPIASVLVRPNLVPPDPPTGLVASAGPNQIALYWIAPAEGQAPGYYVVYANSVGPDFTTATAISTTSSTSFILTGLTAGTQHWFWVRAFSPLNTGSTLIGPVTAVAANAGLEANQFAIERVAALPIGLGAGDIGRVFFLTQADGAYQPNKLYRWNGTTWVVEINSVADIPTGSIQSEQIASIVAAKIDGALDLDNFSSSLRPTESVSVLPSGLNASHEGRVFYLTTDDKLYRWTGTQFLQIGAAGDVGYLAASNFPQSLRPVERVSLLPTTGNFQGRVVYLTTTDSTSFPGTTFAANKLYRWTGSAWTASVPTADLTGTLVSSLFPTDLRPIEKVGALPTGLGAGDAGRVVFLTTDSKIYRWTGSAWTRNTSATDLEGTLGSSLFPTNLRPVEVVASLPATGNTQGRVVLLSTDNKLYRWTGSAWISTVAAGDVEGALAASNFPSNLRPIEVFASLPVSGNTQGRTVLLTTDNKLYRWTGSAWTATVPSSDLEGTLGSSLFPDTLRPIERVASLPAGLSAGQNGRVVFLTTDNKLYRWTGSAWTATVPSSDLEGTLGSSLFPDTLRPIERVSSLPTGLSTAQNGRVVFLTTDNKLYRWTGSVWTAAVQAGDVQGALASANFPSALRPIEVVGTLPSSGNFQGRTVFLTTDSKLYRWTSSSADTGTTYWSASVAATDLQGQISGAQIADLAINVDRLAQNAVTADKLALGAVTASKLATAQAANWVWNPTFVSLDGWTALGVNAGIELADSTWALEGQGGGVLKPTATIGSGSFIEVGWRPNGTTPIGIPVRAGDKIAVQAEVLPKNGVEARLVCYWYDVNGATTLALYSSPVASSAVTDGKTLGNYTRLSAIIGPAPASAVRLDVRIRLANPTASSIATAANPMVVITRVGVGPAPANATEVPEWVAGAASELPGGMIRAGSITSDRIDSLQAIKIDGLITSGQIGGALASVIEGQLTDAQIVEINAAKIAGQITETQIADDSISTPMLKTGAVQADKIAAGAITTTKLAVGSPSNVIWNATPGLTIDGWGTTEPVGTVVGAQVLPVLGSVFDPDWALPGRPGMVFTAASLNNNSYINKPWTPDTYGAGAMPVTAGETLEVQARVACQLGCEMHVYARFFNAAGGATSASTIAVHVGTGPADGKTLANYALIGTTGIVVPVGSVAVTIVVRLTNKSGGTLTDPFGVATCMAIGRAPANATELQPWTPGGVTNISGGVIRTGTIQGRSIAADAITGDKIDAGTITAREIDTGAITAEKIEAGAVEAGKIAAGAISAANLAVGLPNNVIWNGTPGITTDGWSEIASSGTQTGRALLPIIGSSFDPSWVMPGRPGMVLTATTLNSSVYLQTTWTPDGALVGSLPIVPGDRIQIQAQVLTQVNCEVIIYTSYRSAAGTEVGVGSYTVHAGTGPANGSSRANYTRIGGISTAPASAVAAMMVIRFRNASAGTLSNPFAVLTELSIGLATSNQTELPPWAPGGVTTIGGGVIRTGTIEGRSILAGTITAAKIGAGEITTAKLAVGSNSSVIWNACCSYSTDGWEVRPVSVTGILSAASAQWALSGHGSGVFTPGADLAAGQSSEFTWRPDASVFGVPVRPDDYMELQAEVIAIGGITATLFAYWRDSATNSLGLTVVNTQASTAPANGNSLANYNRLGGIIGPAPAGAVTCELRLKITNNTGATIPQGAGFLVFTRTYLGRAMSAFQTELTPWAPGGITQITGGLVKAGTIEAIQLAAGSVKTDKIEAGAITTDKIEAGAITTGLLSAGAVTASKMFIGETSNVYADYDVLDDGYYTGVSGATFTREGTSFPALGKNRIQIASDSSTRQVVSNWFAVEPGVNYEVSGVAYVIGIAPATTARLEIEFGSLSAGDVITSTRLIDAAPASNTTIPARTSANVITTADERRARFVMTKSAVAGGTAGFGGFSLRRRMEGNLIVDGAITTVKLDAEAVTADKIEAGAITTDKLAANSITASKLFVGETGNAYPDYDVLDNDFYSGDTFTRPATSFSASGTNVLQIASDATQRQVVSNWFSIEPAVDYAVSGVAYISTAGGTTARLQIEFGSLNNTGVITSTRLVEVVPATSTTSVASTTVNVVTGSTERRARFVMIKNNIAAADARFSAFFVRRRMEGNLIVDGAITTAKLDAEAVTADKIEAGTITAEQIAANAITASKMFVGETGNAYPDYDILDDDYYTGVGGATFTRPATSGTESGTNVLQIASEATQRQVVSNWFPIESSADYAVSGVAYVSAASGTTAQLQIEFGSLNNTGVITSTRLVDVVPVTSSTSASRATVNVVVGSTERRARFVMIKNNVAGADARFSAFFVRRRMNGNLVVDGAITAAKIDAGAITTDKIEAGAITAGLIAAKAVTADKLTITDLTNIAENADFEMGDVGWIKSSLSTIAEDPANAKSGNYVLTAISGTTGATRNNLRITVVEDDEFYAEAWVKTTGTASGYVRFSGLNSAGAEAWTPAGNTVNSATYALSSVTGKVPAGVVKLRVEVVNLTGTGTVYFDNVRMLRRNNGSLIVDGAITTDKLDAEAVTAEKIDAGAIVADKIAANAVTATKLFVGEVSNSYPDYDMSDGGFYSGDAFTRVATSFSTMGTNRLNIASDATARVVYSNWFTLEAAADYAISGAAFCVTGSTSTTAQLQIELGSVLGDVVTLTRVIEVKPATSSTSIALGTVNILTSASERRARFVMRKNNIAGSPASFGGLMVRRRMNGNLVVDGAINADKLGVNSVIAEKIEGGAVTAVKLAAGSVTAEKLAVGLPNNIIWNSTPGVSTDGWRDIQSSGTVTSPALLPVLGTIYDPTWVLPGQPGMVLTASSMASNAYLQTLWVPDGEINGSMAVVAGETVEIQARVLTQSTCEVIIYARYIVAGDASIEIGIGSYTTHTGTDPANGNALVNYALIGGKSVVPAGATGVTLVVRLRNSSGGALVNPFGVITRMAIGLGQVNQVDLSPWGPGGVTAISGGVIRTNSIVSRNIAAEAITADKIEAGSITASLIAADAITASKMVMGDFTNRAEAGSFASGALSWGVWSAGVGGTLGVLPGGVTIASGAGAYVGNNYLALTAPVSAVVITNGNVFPVVPGEVYYLRATAKALASTAVNLRVRLRFYQGDKTTVVEPAVTASGDVDFTPADTTYTTRQLGTDAVVVPAGAAWAAIQILPYASVTVGGWHVGEVFATRRSGGELIVDGAITTDKLDAGAVTAVKIDAGAITADKIATNAITASKLFVGEVSNTYPDYDAVDADFYSGATFFLEGSAYDTTGRNVIVIGSDSSARTLNSNWFTIEPSVDYDVSGVSATVTGTTVTNRLQIEFGSVNAGGTVTPTRSLDVKAASTSTSTARSRITAFTGVNERRARFVMTKSATSGSGVRFGGFIVRRRVNGDLVVDGAITADKITSNAVTTAKIDAGAVTASKMTIGTGSIIPDGSFDDPNLFWAFDAGGWTVQLSSPGNEAAALGVRRAVTLTTSAYTGTTQKAISSVPFGDIATGQVYALRARGLSSNAARPVYVQLYGVDVNGSLVGSVATLSWQNEAATDKEAQWVAPAGAVRLVVGIVAPTGTAWTNAAAIGNITIVNAATNVMIANGAITAAKLDAGEVITSSAQIGDAVITSAKIDDLQVTSAKIGNLEVGTSKIAYNSVTRVSEAHGYNEITRPGGRTPGAGETACFVNTSVQVEINGTVMVFVKAALRPTIGENANLNAGEGNF